MAEHYDQELGTAPDRASSLSTPTTQGKDKVARAITRRRWSRMMMLYALILGPRDTESDVRSSAAVALGLIGDASVAPALIDALRDAESDVRYSAAVALGHIGDASVVPALIEELVSGYALAAYGLLLVLGRDQTAADGQLLSMGTEHDHDGRDRRGFDAEGIHFETGTRYDPDGNDVSGFNAEGVHGATGTAFDPDDCPMALAPGSRDAWSVEVLGVSLPANPTLLGNGPNARPNAVGIIIDLDQTLMDTSALEERRERSRGESWGWVRDAAGETALMPAAKVAVEALCELGQVCIATNANRYYAQELARHHRLGIPVAAAWHDTAEHKPYPAPLERAARIMGVPASRCIHIGDSADDARAALAAGMECVIIKAGVGAVTVMDVDGYRVTVAADWDDAVRQVGEWRLDLAEVVHAVEESTKDGDMPRGLMVIALGEYHPYRMPDGVIKNPDFDDFSGAVLSVKQGEMEGLAKFFDALDPLLPSNAAIACPPASAVTSSNGIRRLAMRVANSRDRVDATSLFVRTGDVRASSAGGERSVEKHLKSVSVNESTLESLGTRPLIVLDDVITTGSTLRACVELLEPYEVIHVRCVALGRTVR